MSDPRARSLGNPHPISQHRTPDEIAADESGPIGHPDPEDDVKQVLAESSPHHSTARKSRSNGASKNGGKRR